MSMPVVLVLAKAPVPGLVKTRLGTTIGMHTAARLAAMALLDTLQACEEAFGPTRCYAALSGALTDSECAEQIAGRLGRWTVVEQRGAGLGNRIANAHQDIHALTGAPVMQIGMDTPQVDPSDLRDVSDQLQGGTPGLLGPSVDGGWWLLALRNPLLATVIRDVPTSTAHTGIETVAAFRRAGAPLALVGTLRDVDDADDAAAVAQTAAATAFATLWRSVASEVRP